jgi:ABC-2 type transport system ATP-binding protein
VKAEPAGPTTVRFEVSGQIAPLLGQLAGQPVVNLVSRQPSLEEIFLHHYDASDGE